MGIRFMSYSSLLYEDISMRGLVQPPQRLPLVLPILLYSGESRWHAPVQVSDLVDTPPPTLRPYQPDMRYLVVDEGAMVAQGALPADNLAGLLFQLEHCQGIAQAQALLQKVLQLTRQPQYDELRRAFGSWVRHVLFARTLPQATELALTDDLQEISAMLATRSRNWSENLRQEGKQEGAAHILERMLAHKFGPLTEVVRQRLRQADSGQLEAWSLNFIDADSLEDVFR